MTTTDTTPRADELAYQREYYAASRSHARIAPARTAYVFRHLEETLAGGGLRPPARLLEIGCGMGRFTLLLAERGFDVTGLDLSPELIAQLRAADSGRKIRSVVGDAHQAAEIAPGPYDAVLGFFVLHHLSELAPLFSALKPLLAPGGRLVFAEPNAWNPLFYAQIVVTPGMTWRGDGGIARMREGIFRRALGSAGLRLTARKLYGFLPPLLVNTAPGARLDRWLERLLRPVAAFQVIVAEVAP